MTAVHTHLSLCAVNKDKAKAWRQKSVPSDAKKKKTIKEIILEKD